MSGRLRVLGAAAAALLCACGEPGSKAHNDWAFRSLSGRVQQVTRRTYYPDLNTGDLRLAMYSITVFDRDGRLSEERFYDAENRLTGYTAFKRDRSGRVIEEQAWSAAGELQQRVSYQYDESGRRRSEVFYDGESTRTGSYTYQYGGQGRLERRLMEAIYSDGSRRSNWAVYRYDAGGRLIEESYHQEDAPGELLLRVEHTWRDGRRAYSSHYQRGRWLEHRSFYRHDELGNVVEEVSFQIPEDEEGARYELISREEQLPRRLLSSRTTAEYRYFRAD